MSQEQTFKCNRSARGRDYRLLGKIENRLYIYVTQRQVKNVTQRTHVDIVIRVQNHVTHIQLHIYISVFRFYI